MSRQSRIKVPSCLLVTILLLAPLALVAGPVGATTIDKLGTGNKDEILTFTTPGMDSSLYLNLPEGATINSASISLEGMALKDTTASTVDFDFNQTDNKGGWRASTTENVSTTTNTPQSFQGAQIAPGDMVQLANDDGNYLEDFGKMITFEYHQFKYDVSMTDITEIQVEWNGHSWSYTDWTGAPLYGAQMFIWNNQTQAWELLDYYDKWADSSDYWLKDTLTGANLDNYLYNDVELRVIVQNYYCDKGTYFAQIDSDFAKVVVTGKASHFPTDVKLDVNNDGTYELTQAGILTGTISYNGQEFKAQLQGLITTQGPGVGDFKVPLGVSTSTAGKVRVGNVSITYDAYVNKAPDVSDIPNTFHFPEDTDAANLINLTHYFGDDIDASWDLTYAVTNESDPELLHGTISNHGLMSFTTPTENWFGTATFTVKATDSFGLSVTSQAFMVTVDARPDPPVLKHIGALNYTENKGAAVAISATDPDNLYGGTDTLTYSSYFEAGKTLFTINAKTGTAAFIPKDADVGTYTVNFTVTDSQTNTDSEVVTLTVADVNNAPVLASVGKQTMNEDAHFSLQLSATDPDASDAEALVFSAEFPDGMTLFSVGSDGAISFTPNQTMVGTHHVKIVVTDSGGLKDSEEVIFEIKNVNDAPTIDKVADQTINRGAHLSIRALAHDEDIGYDLSEVLVFSDNSNIFDIDENTGWINFTPTKANAGKSTVTITVTDLAGATATTSFKLEVVLNNSAPVAQIQVSNNKTTVKEGGTFVLTAKATDADNDPMTYKWTEGTKELGTEQELTLKGLTIVLEVSDGITKTTVEQTLKVNKKATGIPGFGADLMIVVLALVGTVSFIVSRRKP
jgi:hypothetical protein